MEKETDQVRRSDWETLFNDATPAEREEAVIYMLRLIEKRENSIIELCKSNPLQLEALPISKLREIADRAIEEAHALIIGTHPDTIDILLALESLMIFSYSTAEPTAAELRDTITDIRAIWTAGGPVEDHTRPPSMLIASEGQDDQSVSTETK